jgi:very-short-patch-repair endonuclease
MDVERWTAELAAVDAAVPALAVDLGTPPDRAAATLLRGEPVRLRALTPHPRAATALRRLHDVAARYAEDYGLAVAWLAERPLVITRRGLAPDDVELRLAGPAPAPPDWVVTLRTTAGAETAEDVRALADAVAAGPLAGRTAPAAPPPPDVTPVLDLDAEQVAVLSDVLAGRDVVVEAVPGTGVTQVVAAAVAALAARGDRVLVVAEKRAALTGLLARLDRVGLADLVLDAQDGRSDRRLLAAALATNLPGSPPPGSDGEQARRPGLRDRLGAHHAAMHDRREPWDVSLARALLHRAALPAEAASRARVTGAALQALAGDTLAEARRALRDWADLGGASLTAVDTPWYGAAIRSAEDAHRALTQARRLGEETLPHARAVLERTLSAAGLPPVAAVADWAPALALLADVARVLDALAPDLWTAPLVELVAATGPRAEAASMPWSVRRRARRRARRLWRGPRPSRVELHAALTQAADVAARWSRAGADSPPRAANDLAKAGAAYDALAAELAELGAVLPDRDLFRLTPPVLAKTLAGLAADTAGLRRMPRLGLLTERLTELGLRPLLLELVSRRVPADLAPLVFEHAWLSSVLDVLLRDTGNFDGEALRRTAAGFRVADAAAVAAAPAAVRRACAERLAAIVDGKPDQAGALRAAARARPAVPLRDLVAAAPDALFAVKPCWLLSPYRVARLLPPERVAETVVVLDPTGALPVAAVAGAVARAAHVVVVTAPASPLAALPLPRRRLRTLRRGDERLLGPCAGDLVTVPAASTEPVVSTVLVDEAAELQKVVGLVLDAAVRRPAESLGVVTASEPQAERVADGVWSAVSGRPELREFFLTRFAVRPAARIAGDACDSVIVVSGGDRDVECAARLLARRRVTVLARTWSADPVPAPAVPTPVEAAVVAALAARGIRAQPRYGASAGAVEFACLDAAGRPVLAVETDGERYAGLPTVRDRERLRPEALERRGWFVHRLWLLEWFLHREAALDRVAAAYAEASRG